MAPAGRLLPLLAVPLLAPAEFVAAFSPPSSLVAGRRPPSGVPSGRTREASRGFGRGSSHAHGPSLLELGAQNYNEDYGEDEDEEEEEDGLDALYGKKLGINIGSYLPSLSPDEIANIKSAAQKTLDAAVDSRLADIEDLKKELQEDLQASRERMATAAELNVQYEKQNLMERIDRISNDFLNQNEDFRESTKKAADADALSGREGRGVDLGSWGDVGDGAVVVVGEGASGGVGRLLGSVDAARRRGRLIAEESKLDGSAVVDADVENRVLVVVDESRVS